MNRPPTALALCALTMTAALVVTPALARAADYHHVHITASAPSEAVGWYEEHLDCLPVADRPDAADVCARLLGEPTRQRRSGGRLAAVGAQQHTGRPEPRQEKTDHDDRSSTTHGDRNRQRPRGHRHHPRGDDRPRTRGPYPHANEGGDRGGHGWSDHTAGLANTMSPDPPPQCTGSPSRSRERCPGPQPRAWQFLRQSHRNPSGFPDAQEATPKADASPSRTPTGFSDEASVWLGARREQTGGL